jgi:hypothetical protein
MAIQNAARSCNAITSLLFSSLGFLIWRHQYSVSFVMLLGVLYSVRRRKYEPYRIFTTPCRAQSGRAQSRAEAYCRQSAGTVTPGIGPRWDPWPYIYFLYDNYIFSFSCGAPSLTRGRVWLLYMLLALASAIFLWSTFNSSVVGSTH